MKTEKAAGIIIFRKTQDGIKFLILYHGGQYWNFPKGKMAEGEETIKTAFREVREETGLLERDLRLKGWFKVYDKFSFKRNKEDVSKTVVFYLAETSKKFIAISKEHEGYAWFSYKEAIRILQHENLKQNLKKAHDFILGRRKTLDYVPRNKKFYPQQKNKNISQEPKRPFVRRERQFVRPPHQAFEQKQNPR